jgi:hypothetical protein
VPRPRAIVLFRGLALLLAGVAIATSLVQAEEKADVTDGACYSASFPREQGPIREIAARVEPSGEGEGSEPYRLSIAFTEWDVPNQVFDTVAACSLSGNMLNCGIDCDGGQAKLVAGDDGRLFMQTSSLRFGATGDQNLLSVGDADSGALTGLHALRRDTARKDCRPTPDRVFAALEIGDISPRVQQAEGMLGRIGQFLDFPDTVFDDATEAAVRTFQGQYGLGQSGRIDDATAVALVRASASGGGC